MLKKLAVLILVTPLFVYADNSVGTVVASTLAAQVVNTGAAVYMKNNGMQPQYVSTPYGVYVVPTTQGSTTNNSSASPSSSGTNMPQPSEYEIQNQQQNKQQFFNASVVQAFPNTPGNTGTSN